MTKYLFLFFFVLLIFILNHHSEEKTLVFESPLQSMLEKNQWKQLINFLQDKKQVSAKEKIALAKAYFELGEVEKSIRLVDEAQAAGEIYPLGRALRIESLLALSQKEQALKHAQTWVNKFPEDAEAHYHLANCLRRNLKFEKSIYHYKKALEKGTQEETKVKRFLADVLMHLGKVNRDGGDGKRAIDYMEESIKYETQQGSFHAALGKAYANMQFYDKAIKAFESALSKGLKDKQAVIAVRDEIYEIHHSRATIALVSEKNYEKALKEAKAALKRASSRRAKQDLNNMIKKINQLLVNELRKKGRENKDINIWKRIMEIKAGDHEARWELAQKLPDKERQKEEDYLIEYWPSEAKRKLALRFWKNGEKEKAILYMIEHYQYVVGTRQGFEAEKKIFNWLRQVPTAPVTSSPWYEMSLMFQSEANMQPWKNLVLAVNVILPERYFVWLYEVEIRIKSNEYRKSAEILQELESLDPPEAAREKMQALKSRLPNLP